jgi:tripartite-type tricarboxylate transporter receptor subunit TctC
MPSRLIRRFVLSLALLGSVAPALAAEPSDYPRRPLRFMIGFAPGGSADLVSRLLAQKLSDRLGQPIVAEQKMGATGILANDVVVKAPPDGHTLILLTGGHPAAAVIMKAMPHDPVRDFAMVSTVTGYPMVIAASPDAPYRNFAEFISWARARPGQVTYAMSGIGSVHHLLGELVNIEAGTQMTGIPLKGASQSMVEVLGGRIDIMIETATASFGPIHGGRLRALALSSPARYPLMPDAPIIAETLPGVEVMSWLGLATTPGTPRPIIERLNREVRAILAERDVQARLADLGGVALPSSPEEMRERIEREIARWRRVVEIKHIERQ